MSVHAFAILAQKVFFYSFFCPLNFLLFSFGYSLVFLNCYTRVRMHTQEINPPSSWWWRRCRFLSVFSHNVMYKSVIATQNWSHIIAVTYLKSMICFCMMYFIVIFLNWLKYRKETQQWNNLDEFFLNRYIFLSFDLIGFSFNHFMNR